MKKIFWSQNWVECGIHANCVPWCVPTTVRVDAKSGNASVFLISELGQRSNEWKMKILLLNSSSLSNCWSKFFYKTANKVRLNISKANQTYMYSQGMSHVEAKCHLNANLIEIILISNIFLYFLTEKRTKHQQRMINVKLSFNTIHLTFCDLTYTRWRPKWLPDYFMSDTMFQSFN